jgi:hypothetical protein
MTFNVNDIPSLQTAEAILRMDEGNEHQANAINRARKRLLCERQVEAVIKAADDLAQSAERMPIPLYFRVSYEPLGKVLDALKALEKARKIAESQR